ncbi:MAG: DUF1580 domain-containing protein [Planctomycetota bacterium]|nr:DUF1580 domain-containing protein [Planctomycetota bacterium]
MAFSTVWRWSMRGSGGVKLETLRIGRTLCTSEEALKRFFARLTDPSASSTTRTPTQRQRDVERAEAELAAARI